MQEHPRTPRGVDYKEGYPDLLKRKLDIPRDSTGEPNTEMLRVMRTLHREVGSQVGFIGIAPKGSAVRGYNEEGKSDFDYAIFYDSALQDLKDKGHRIVKGEEVLMREEKILKHTVSSFLYDLNKDLVRQHFSAETYDFPFYTGLVALCGPTVGPHVEEYREMIGAMIKEYQPEQRSRIEQRILDTAVELEKGRILRIARRIDAELDGQKGVSVVESRRPMYKERINKILHLDL